MGSVPGCVPPTKRSILSGAVRSEILDVPLPSRGLAYGAAGRLYARRAFVSGLPAQDGPTPHDSLLQENAFLHRRNAQLQDDITALTAEANRLHQQVQRLQIRMGAPTPDPKGGEL